jgi:hypothetical protein
MTHKMRDRGEKMILGGRAISFPEPVILGKELEALG